MRIAIIGDSHDNLTAIEKAIEKIKEEKCELIIHTGDFVAPFSVKKIRKLWNRKVFAVFGNNDGEKVGISRMFDEYGWEISEPPRVSKIGDKRFALFHALPDSLKIKEEIDYVLFGHTHKVFIEYGHPLILNPGELGGHLTGEFSFLILNEQRNKVEKFIL